MTDPTVAMCDIIEVSAEDFMGCKERVSAESVELKIRNKIEQLLSAHDCFTKDIQFFAPPSHHRNASAGGGHGGYRHGHANGRGGRRGYHHRNVVEETCNVPRTLCSSKKPTSEVSGLLNKVTASTYHVLVQKIIRFCAYKECSQDVIGIILHKCYIHGSYSYLYHNILHEMYHRYPKEVKEATEHFTANFMTDLPVELESLQFQPHPVKEYEAFCVYTKRKKILLDKLFNVIIINRKYKGEASLTNRIYGIIFDHLEHVIRSKDATLFDFLDLLSTIIAILKKEKCLPPGKSDELFFVYKDIKAAYDDLPKKIQFSWEKLANNKA